MILFAAVATSRPFVDAEDRAVLGHVVLLMALPSAVCGCRSGDLRIAVVKVASVLLVSLSAVACLTVATDGLPNAFRIAFLCMPTVILLSGAYSAAVAWDFEP